MHRFRNLPTVILYKGAGKRINQQLSSGLNMKNINKRDSITEHVIYANKFAIFILGGKGLL